MNAKILVFVVYVEESYTCCYIVCMTVPLNILRTKRVIKVKSKAFFIIFKGLLVPKNCLRPESAPLKARTSIQQNLLSN